MKKSSILSLLFICVCVVVALICVKIGKSPCKPSRDDYEPVSTEEATHDNVDCVKSANSEVTPTPTNVPMETPTEVPTTAPVETAMPTVSPTTVSPETTEPIIVSRSAYADTDYLIHKELFKGVALEVDISQIYYFEPDYDTSKYITRKTERNEYNYELLAKLLCCEAGGKYSTWEMQVWTLCAILNNLDRTNRSLKNAAHDSSQYSVAPWVDEAVPDEINYRAIDFVLNGHRIAKINCFRTKYYHDFGTPIASVDGEHYFSMF